MNPKATDGPVVANAHQHGPEPFVGYRDAAAYLGVAVGTLYSWVSARRIRFYKIGPRCIRFKIGDLREWIDARAVAPAQKSSVGGVEPASQEPA